MMVPVMTFIPTDGSACPLSTNAKSALAAVDADSRLGWLASSGYTGSRPQIEWKLRKMRELYGDALGAR